MATHNNTPKNGHKAENGLFDASEMHRFFELSVDMLCIADSEGYFKQVNPAFENTLGWSAGELENKRFIELVHPDDTSSTQSKFDDLAESSGDTIRFTNRYLSQDGNYHWLSWNAQPAKDGSIYAVAHDVTSHRRVEEALKGSEKRFQRFVSSLGDHIYVTRVTDDGQQINEYISPNVEHLTGYSVDILMSDWSFWGQHIIHPEDREIAAEQASRLTQGKDSEEEYRIIKADGTVIWVRDSARVEQDADTGCVIVYGVVSDVTKRKETEETLRQREERTSLLYKITSQAAKDIDEQLVEALALTKDLLGLDVGIISHIEGNSYRVRNFHAPGTDLAQGQTFELGNTYCDITLKAKEIVTIDHMAVSEHKRHPCYGLFQLESYIGTPIWVNGERYGTINFSGAHPKMPSFSAADRDMVELLGYWAGSVIERQIAEKALREKEARLSEAQQMAKLGNWTWEIDTDRLAWSSQLFEIYGMVPKTELTFSAYEKLIHPEERDAVVRTMTTALERGHSSYEFEHRIIRPDGELRYVSGFGRIERDEQDKPIKVVGIAQDVTETKLAEETIRKQNFELTLREDKLKQNLEKLQATQIEMSRVYAELKQQAEQMDLVQQVVHIGGWDIDVDSHTMKWNEMMYKICGLPRRNDGPALEEFRELWHPDDRDQFMENLTRLMREGARLEQELRLLRGDQIIWTYVAGLPQHDQDGNVVKVFGLLQDITRLKRAEAAQAWQANRLATVAQIATTVSTISEPQVMLQSVVDLTKERFDLYHVEIYLLNQTADDLVLTAASGTVGQQIIAEGHAIPINHPYSRIAEAARTGEGFIVGNILADDAPSAHPLLKDVRSAMSIPMIVGDKLLGVLDIQSDEADQFTEQDIQIDTTLAAQIAVALQNAQLLERSESALQELDALTRRLTREGWGDYLGGRETFGFAYDRSNIKPLDKLSERTGQDYRQHLSMQGEVIGQLELSDPQEFSDSTSEIVEIVGQRLSAHLENLRLTEQTARTLARTQALYEVSGALLSAERVSDVYHTVVGKLSEALGAHTVSLYILDFERRSVSTTVSGGPGTPEISTDEEELFEELWNGLAGWSVRELKPAFSSKDSNDERMSPKEKQRRAEQDIGSVIVAPIHHRGLRFGVLTALHSVDHPDFDETEMDLLVVMANQLAVTIDNQSLFDQTQDAFLEQQEARLMLDKRVRELNCLNAIGRKISETPTVPDLLKWVAQRIPEAMQHPGICRVAIRHGDEIYGRAEAVDLSHQIVNALRIDNVICGKIYIAYTQPQDFLDEESTLLGGITTRVNSYLESQKLFEQTQSALAATEALYQVGQIVGQLSTREQMTRQIATALIDQLRYSSAWIALVDKENALLKGIAGAGYGVTDAVVHQQIRLNASRRNPSIQAVIKKSALLINDVSTDERAADLDPDVRAILGRTIQVPIIGSGNVIGLLAVNRPTTTPELTQDDVDLLAAVARQIAIGLQNLDNLEQIQTALEEANIFRQLVEASGQGIGIATLDGTASYANSAFLQMLGEKDMEELIGTPITEYYPEEQQKIIREEAIPTVMKTGRWSGETVIAPKNGSQINAIEMYSLLRDKNGNPLYIADVATDITDRKQVEQVLRKNEEQLAQALKIANLSYWELNLADGVFTANDQFYRIFRTDAARENGYQIPMQTYFERFVHPDDVALVRKKLANIEPDADPDYTGELEYRIIRCDGTHGYVSVQFRLEIDAATRRLDRAIGTIQDITERKQTEEALMATAEENSRLAIAVNSAAIGVTVSDPSQPDNPLVFANPAFTAITGYAAEEALGSNCRFLQGADTDPAAIAEIRQAIAEERSVTVELLNYRKDGTPFWNELTVTPIFDENGHAINYVGIQFDITDRKNAELEREKLLTEVEAAYKKYVRNEWEELLLQHQGNWRVEYQSENLPLAEEVERLLAQLRKQALREKKLTFTAENVDEHPNGPAAVVAPIALRGESIGTISLQDADPNRRWSAEELALIETVTEQLAQTIENMRLFDNTQRRASREQLTRKITDKMRNSPDVESIIEIGISELAEALGVDRTYVRLAPETVPSSSSAEASINPRLSSELE